MNLRPLSIKSVFILSTVFFAFIGDVLAESNDAGTYDLISSCESYRDTSDEYQDYILVADSSGFYLESDSSYYMEFDGTDTTGYIEYEIGEEIESQWMIVRAYLIYDDNTVSPTDLIENEVALWNTTIGEGDGGGPSHKTKIVLNGMASDFKLDVRNGKKIALQKEGLVLNGDLEFVIEDTGCDPVNILVFFAEGDVLTEKISFVCGE